MWHSVEAAGGAALLAQLPRGGAGHRRVAADGREADRRQAHRHQAHRGDPQELLRAGRRALAAGPGQHGPGPEGRPTRRLPPAHQLGRGAPAGQVEGTSARPPLTIQFDT